MANSNDILFVGNKIARDAFIQKAEKNFEIACQPAREALEKRRHDLEKCGSSLSAEEILTETRHMEEDYMAEISVSVLVRDAAIYGAQLRYEGAI